MQQSSTPATLSFTIRVKSAKLSLRYHEWDEQGGGQFDRASIVYDRANRELSETTYSYRFSVPRRPRSLTL